MSKQRALNYFFWHAMATLFHWYVLLLTKKTALLFGVLKRNPSIKKEDVLAMVNFENPAQYYDFFKDKPDTSEYQVTLQTKGKKLNETHFQFESPFTSAAAMNNIVPSLLYSNAQPTKKVVIFVSALFVSFNWSDRVMTRLLAKSGFDACSIALPYHGPRTTIKPGLEWLSSDAVAVTEAFTQSVLDVNKLHDILRDKFGYEEIYIVGLSIGGNIACVSTFIKNYQGGCYITTGVSTADLIVSSPLPYVEAVHKDMNKTYPDADIQALWAMGDTSRFTGAQKCPRNMVIAGFFDKFAKPELTQRMYKSLKNCELVIYPASHYNSFIFLRTAFKNILRFFSGKAVHPTSWRLNV